ncbi:MAG TPA: class I SAM-dependent methyltransferase [Nocardioidaceae bacterium]
MDETRVVRATSFGGWADEYQDCRPSYPDSAVNWLLGDAREVVEVGAGTGKLTDRLVEHKDVSLRVTEIDGRMLRLVSERHSALPVHEAAVTNLPVEDGSVDAVLVADAWHWFPNAEAAAEVGRVLRRGGWLGCIWNDLSAATPDWQWEAVNLSADIAARVRALPPLDRLGLTTGDAEQEVVRWNWSLTPREWRGYVSTVSHVRTMPPGERLEVLDAAERLASAACAATGASTVSLILDAVCIRWYPAQ